MKQQKFYVRIAVEGIQKYICSTGKLKEMIGGSEIINYMASPDFYSSILDSMNLAEDREALGLPAHYIVAQANAGTLCLIMPEETQAREFLAAASRKLIEYFPGLPFYCALVPFDWSDDAEGGKIYSTARQQAEEQISDLRNTTPIAQGAPLLPILRTARIDGLAAFRVEHSNNSRELISLPSASRRNEDMIEKSRNRLRREITPPEGISLQWADDLDKMLGNGRSTVALICMDGNDLGKLFRNRLESQDNATLSSRIVSMRKLSDAIQQANTAAFKYACEQIAHFEAAQNPARQEIMMPLRPLVMGGDDITIIARADIALPFAAMFSRKFMEAGRDYNLSVGIGMVVMSKSYPFAKAFPLAETLQDSAKGLTSHLEPGARPSSLDYLVLTEDVENDLESVRQRLYTTGDNFLLTTKPLRLSGDSLAKFVNDGLDVITELPRSQIREAWTIARKGPEATRKLWENLLDNIRRGLGGRKGKLMKESHFLEIFPDNFFVREANGQSRSPLGDYLELERLLPDSPNARQAVQSMIEGDMNNV